MKRIAIIILLSLSLGVLYYKYSDLKEVSAGPGGGNPNFVSQEEFSSVLQTSIDVVWRDVEIMKNRLNAHDSDLAQINDRLGNIEKQLTEIRSLLN